MDTAPVPAERAGTTHPETETGRQDRIAWEAAGIAEADAELDSGLYVDPAEMRAWVESIGTDRELPPPHTRQR